MEKTTVIITGVTMFERTHENKCSVIVKVQHTGTIVLYAQESEPDKSKLIYYFAIRVESLPGDIKVKVPPDGS